ncbi:uncharacterized protein (DUF433 family)/DNA-binding transcriptional MerR regulator [Bradyrhizobium elkanii]
MNTDMLNPKSPEPDGLGRGVYSGTEALRLLNFARPGTAPSDRVSRSTVARWLKGYEHGPVEGEGKNKGYSPPLWRPDYANDDDLLEISFRDLIELRFVKSFRDIGLSLRTIRECYQRASEEVHDERPFSTKRFRTDGKTIFLEITEGVKEGKLVDLRRRQNVFKAIVEPSLRDLEFEASTVARWFPLGIDRRAVVIDPARSFGQPIVSVGVPTEVLATAVQTEGSIEAVAALYDVPKGDVRFALDFERRLAA